MAIVDNTDQEVDSLGFTDKENLQMDALKLGAQPSEVASLSRQSVEDIPQLFESSSEFEELEVEAFPEVSEFEESIPTTPSKKAARDSIHASLAKSGDIVGDYQGMYDQFVRTGTSSMFDSIQNDINDQKIRELKRFIIDTARQGDVEGTESLVQASDTLLEEETDLMVAGLKNASESFAERSGGARDQEHSNKFLQNLLSGRQARKTVDQIIDIAVAESSGDIGDYAVNITEQAIIGEQIFGLSNVGKEILGERYLFQGGTMMRDLAQHLRRQPKDKKEEVAQQIVDSIVKNSGVVKNNDVVKVFALEEFRKFANTPGGDLAFDRWLHNVVGYAEIGNVLQLATAVRFFRNLFKMKDSPSTLMKTDNVAGDLQQANPELDAILKASNIENEQTAAQLGTTVGEAAAKAMPSPILDDLVAEGAPNSLVDKLNGQKTIAEEIQEFTDNTFLYADADYKAKNKRIADILLDEKVSTFSKPAYTSIARDEGGNNLIVKAIYGDETDLPLTRIKAKVIQKKLTDMMEQEGIKNANPTVVSRDPLTRTYSASTSASDEGPFFVSLDFKAPMGYEDIVAGEVLGQGSTKGVGSVFGARSASWMMDPQTYISRTLLGAARVSNDKKFYVSNELQRLAKPFTTLNWFGKKRIANLLETGEADKKVFKFKELEGRYSNREIEAYYSARLLNDTVYNIKNADMRTRLKDEGFKTLSVNLGNDQFYRNAARVVDILPSNVRTVFEPATGTKIAVTTENLQDIQERGLVLVRLLKGSDQGNNRFTYAAVNKDDLSELPANVYPYHEGYNFRINNDPYFIDRKSKKSTNGVVGDHINTVGVARSAEEAKRFVDQLKKEFPDDTFTSRLDRNISSTDSMLENDIDTLDGSGLQFWFSNRGERLQRLDGTQSSVEDPVTAMNRMISSVANVVTHRELLETSLQRHRKTFGNVEVDGQKLWTWSKEKNDWHFDKTLKEAGREDVRAAKLEYEYLENLKYTPTTVDKAWKNILESIDQTMGQRNNILPFKIGEKARTKLIQTLATTSPGQIVRGATFALTIPLRPLRHLVLQSTTGLSLTGIDPGTTVRAFKDTNLMLLSMATWQRPALWNKTKQWATMFGYTPEEWEEVFNAFRQTGKAYAIDSNVAIGEANFAWSRSMPDTFAGAVGDFSLNALKSPITAGKWLGFDTGELANQSLTWLFARRRWIKENPDKNWKSQKALDEITNQARNFSVDMTKTSAFAYQQGAFASMTQFMAINHKMLLRMLKQDPDLTPDHITHGKYVAGLFAIYGAAGLGMQDFYDSWIKESDIEIPKYLDDALYGGFTQALFNKSLDLAFSEEFGTNRTAFSDSFSPGSGTLTFAPEFVENLLEGNMLEAFSGPFSSVFPNIKKAAKYSADVWALDDDLNTPEKVIKSYQVALREFGGFSDYFKHNLAVAYNEKMGTLNLVGKDGRPTLEANGWGEIWAKSLIGLNTRGENELYNKYLDMHKEFTSSGKKNEAQIDKDAKHLVKYLYETWANSSDQFDFSEKAKAISFALHKGDKMYGMQVLKKAQQQFSVNPKFEQFVSDIVRNFALLDPNANFNSMRNAVRNSDGVSKEHKATLIERIDALETSSENSRQLINENF